MSFSRSNAIQKQRRLYSIENLKMYNSYPKNSGIYFVRDNIDNLQFKIHLRPISTLLKLPKYNFHTNSSNEQRTNATGLDENEDCTTITLKWQQKVFSPTERELLKDERNCLTDQQRKYHQMIKESEREVTAKDKKHSRKRRHRKGVKTEEENHESNLIFTYVNGDEFEPSDEVNQSARHAKHSTDSHFEIMYVYAALKPDTQLVLLKWFTEEKLLYIYPDFNNFQNHPYFIELDTDYRHLYGYGIEDISLKATPSVADAEEFVYLPELSTHWRYEDELAQMFAMPPRRTQRYAILFALNDAGGFEYDNIHVRYNVQLPSHTILEEGPLESSSQSVSQLNNSGSCHIGWSFQITILCEEHFDPSQPLKIYFQIISIDSWERERLEGFCHYSLKLLRPHNETVVLQCLRPVESFLESLSRYFIGGRRKFDYIRFLGQTGAGGSAENDETSNFQSRYGLRMRNSGHLSLSCQMLTQRNCELLNPCGSRTSGMTLDDIMMAYKEARRRLEAVSVK